MAKVPQAARTELQSAQEGGVSSIQSRFRASMSRGGRAGHGNFAYIALPGRNGRAVERREI